MVSRWEQGVILGVGDLSAVFLREMGLGAVGIAPRSAGRWRVVTAHRAERLRGRRWFCGNPGRATLVADVVRPQLHKLGAGVSIEAAANAVTATARTLGVFLVTEDRVREHSARVVAQVEAQFESLAAAGELQSVNRRYREYRIAATAAGKKPLGYPTFISNYKAGLMRVVAQHSRITVLENGK